MKSIANTCRKEKYWITHPKKRNTKEWCEMPIDWLNEHKLGSVDCYFFRYDNLIKGKENNFILKSVFGRRSNEEINEEINWWYSMCIGVYSEIKLN